MRTRVRTKSEKKKREASGTRQPDLVTVFTERDGGYTGRVALKTVHLGWFFALDIPDVHNAISGTRSEDEAVRVEADGIEG